MPVLDIDIKASPEQTRELVKRVMSHLPGAEPWLTPLGLGLELGCGARLDRNLARLEAALAGFEAERQIGEPLTLTARTAAEPAGAGREIQLGRFVIVPAQDQRASGHGQASSGLAAELEKLVIRLDRGGAFGSGAHPSTTLALEAVWEHFHPGPGQPFDPDAPVLDAGCGSGVLSIAAALMGARRVTAIDTSQEAVETALANIALNGLSSQIIVQKQDIKNIDGPWSLILANLDPTALAAHAARLGGLAGAETTVICTGFTDAQAPSILKKLTKAGLATHSSSSRQGWAALVLGR